MSFLTRLQLARAKNAVKNTVKSLLGASVVDSIMKIKNK